MRNGLKALALSPLFLVSYCYSETIYGTTPNAASQGLTWAMSNVLPQQAGLQVSGVIYQYTAVKDPSADMLVHVQNENAQGQGYIFRETDDWSGLPGNTINKLVAVADLPIQLWGQGSIEVEGDGSVSDPNVAYTYKYDPCFDPQSSPACPGYVPPVPINEAVDWDVYDALDDEAVRKATDETDPELYDRDGEKRRAAQQKQDDRLERGLAASENALNIASGAAQDFMVAAMANQARFNPYYVKELAGGTYTDALSLPTKDIPDNKKGLRNGLAQQLMHERMVESQYK